MKSSSESSSKVMVFFGGCINNLGFLDEVILEPEAFSIKLFSVFFDEISMTVSVF